MDSASGIQLLILSTLAVAAKCDPQDINEQTMLADLAIDSLSLTTLIARIEALCATELSPDAKMAIYDADDVAAVVTVAREAALRGGAVHAPDA